MFSLGCNNNDIDMMDEAIRFGWGRWVQSEATFPGALTLDPGPRDAPLAPWTSSLLPRLFLFGWAGKMIGSS